ncbi:GDSL esterase/lipase At2g30310-like [Euphorbia lathyris]|uniref:GDSL esterase/lipase At2g30310-like n=1 Tax=Euphorbia lathyris TaxID=212925 RepID=UPI0033131521
MAAIKFLTIFFFLYKVASSTNSPRSPKFPALFVIGDSVMDTGNNKYIPTWVKSNYSPYGQNYTTHLPTGRFSNGKLISDMLVSYLGIKDALPPFLTPTLSSSDLVTGVNFASAGSGFDDLTSLTSGSIPVSKQIQHFKLYVDKLKSIVGEGKAYGIVKSSLIVLSAGTNDWFFNYYDIPTRKLTYDVNGYQDFLLNRMQSFIKELYELGCRSIMVSGLAPTGCIPIQMAWSIEKHCKEDQNRDSQIYNQKLVKILSELQTTLPGIKLVYNDFYTSVIDMINHPKNYGFIETTKGCCIEQGKEYKSMFCSRKVAPCKNPDQYIFWDQIHPTLATYNYIFKYMTYNVLPQFL